MTAVIDRERQDAPAPEPPSRVRSGLARALSPWTVVVILTVALLAYLTGVPLYFLIHDTFSGPDGFTLDHFGRAYGNDSGAGEMLYNSVVFAVGSALLSLVVGGTLAYLHVRTDVRYKGLLFIASFGPLIIPGFLYTAAWIFIADPGIGLVNTLFLTPLFGVDISIFSMGGMIWVQGLHHAPIAFLLMFAAFRAMDPSLEESALMSGAPRRVVLRRITVPMLRPAILGAVLLVFIQSLEAFEVPALLGLQSGVYVFTSRIYLELRSFPVDYGATGAYAIALLGIAVIGVLLSAFLSRDVTKYQTISGKAFRPRPMELGGARTAVNTGVLVYFVIALVLPLVVLVYASLLPFYRGPSVETLRSLSLVNYQRVIDLPAALTALQNTFVLGIATATATMLLTAVAAWLVVRTKAPGRRLVDLLTFSPLVVPGLVFGLALSFVYLRTPLPIYGTLLILLIAYTTKFLPFGMRYASVAMVQASGELEESALVSGASRMTIFRRVLLPLASSGMIAGWIYVLVISFRELSASILLYSPGNEVISVLIFDQFNKGEFTVVAAMGVIMIAILVVLVLIAYRLGARVGVRTDDDS